jgi:hypothetical protein
LTCDWHFAYLFLEIGDNQQIQNYSGQHHGPFSQFQVSLHQIRELSLIPDIGLLHKNQWKTNTLPLIREDRWTLFCRHQKAQMPLSAPTFGHQIVHFC